MELRKTTLAKVICSNTELPNIQRNVFMKQDEFEWVERELKGY